MKSADLIVRTKLFVPRTKKNILKRKKPLELLKRHIDKRLILICSDAGYGKTTLLSQFCEGLGKPYLYYALEPSDNDITTFFNYLIAGMRKTYRNFGKRTESILGQTRNKEIIVGTFINEIMEEVDDDFYIILDDYHHLHTNRELTRALDYFLHHQPAHIHLIISSRATPPFDLSFFLAKQELFKLEKAHLQFKPSEIKKLFKDIYDFDITDADLERVVEHSEGWITAVQLILQKIISTGEEGVKRTLNGYVASGEELFDYFAREVFLNQPKKIQNFLLKTSFLDRLDVDLCNRLFATKKSGTILRRLENEHIFISRLGKTAYQYHHLFQKFVNNIAQKHFTDAEINSLYLKCGRFYQEKGEFESAMDYYLRGGHYRRSAGLLKKIAEQLITSGRLNRINRWFAVFPDSFFKKDLTLMNIRAEIMWHSMQMEESLALFKQVMRLARKKKDHRALFTAQYGAARVFASTGRFNDVLKLLKKCRNLPGVKRIKLGDVYNLEGISYVYLNKFKQAELRFEKSAKIFERYGGIEQNSSLVNNLAIIAFTKGELEKSVKIFKKLIRTKPNALVEPHVQANLALALIDLGRLDQARAALKIAYKRSRQFVNMRAYLMFLLALGFYRLEKGDYDRAGCYFRRIIKLSSDMQERLSEEKAKHGLMKTLYLSGDLAAAKELAEESLAEDKVISGIRNHDPLLLKGLIELERDELKAAEATFLRSLKIVENTEFKYSLMRNYYYLAYLYLTMKRWKKAEHYLKQALNMAQKYNYDYFLIRTGKKTTAPLEYAVKKGLSAHYAESILSRVIAASKLNIRFFGDFEVSLHGSVIKSGEWQTRKAQLVFAYLICNRTQPIAKEELMDKFSTQDKPGLANQEIRTTISRIQKALRLKKFVTYERGFYRVNRSLKVYLDIEEFETIAKQTIAGRTHLTEKDVEKAQYAVSLYRDDFLVAFYDNWCGEVRIYLRNLYFNMLIVLGGYYLERDALQQALSFFKKVLERESLNEEANVGFIKCLIRLNRKSEAVRHFVKFKKRLQRELGLEPSHEIASLINK